MLGAVSAIVTVAGAVLLPYLRGYITEVQYENMKTPRYRFENKPLIHEFVESAEFEQIAREWIETHGGDDLRTDLAIKMDVAPDEVHIELGRMYTRMRLTALPNISDHNEGNESE